VGRAREKIPPALEALKGVRDAHATKLLSGSGGFPEYHEYFAINRTLKEHENTYRLFLKLDAAHPEIAKRCFDVTMELIVEHKNFDLYEKYGGDPIARYERIQNMRETNLGLARKNPTVGNDRFKEYTDKSFTDKTVQLIEILVHLKRLDEAREIQKRALAYFPHASIERSLMVK
jgi:transposase-like protein